MLKTATRSAVSTAGDVYLQHTDCNNAAHIFAISFFCGSITMLAHISLCSFLIYTRMLCHDVSFRLWFGCRPAPLGRSNGLFRRETWTFPSPKGILLYSFRDLMRNLQCASLAALPHLSMKNIPHCTGFCVFCISR